MLGMLGGRNLDPQHHRRMEPNRLKLHQGKVCIAYYLRFREEGTASVINMLFSR